MAIGQIPKRALISAVTNAPRCLITTKDDHGYSTGDQVRITDLNSAIPVLRGMDEINNGLFKIVVDSPTSFYIKDVIRDTYIDSTNFPPYVTGGRCNLVNQEFIFHGDE